MSDPVSRLGEAIDRRDPDGIRDHRISCCAPRQGTPDLAGVPAGSAS